MKRPLLNLIFAFSVAISASAQSPKTLSLDEALHRGLTTNSSIEAAQFQEEAALQRRRATQGLRLPQIAVTGNYTLLDKDISFNANALKQSAQNIFSNLIGSGVEGGAISPAVAEMLQNSLASLNGASWSIPLQKRNFGIISGEIIAPLFTGGRINSAIKASRLAGDIAHQQTLQAENTLITDIVRQYFSLALATKAIEVRRAALDGIERHLNNAIALEREGIIARSERLYMEYRRAEAEGALQGAILEQKTLTDALCNAISDNAEEYSLTTPMFVLQATPPIDTFLSSAQRHNPLLAQASIATQIAEEGLRFQRADYFPQVAFVGSGTIYQHRLSPLVPRWVIGLNVSIKLFDGLNREYRYAAAKSDVRATESISHQARNDITILVETLYNRLLDAQNRIASLSTSITFATAYLHDKEAAFREGLASATDLTDAELNLAKARIERLEAVCTYDITLAMLLEAAGQSARFIDYTTDDNASQITFHDK